MSRYIPAEVRRRVREHFAESCAYCHTAERNTVVTFEVEHITPLAAGGTSEFDNLCFACPSCNRHKSDRTSATDPATGSSAPIYHALHDNWLAHFAWSANGCELIGLTPTGRATIAALHMNRPQLTRTRALWVALGEHPPLVDQ